MGRDVPQDRSEVVKISADTKTISRMATQYDVSLRTLRFYEDRGLLFPYRIGRARFYSPKDEIRLQLIQKGKKLGFSLAEIERLLFTDKSAEQKAASTQLDTAITDRLTLQDINKKIHELERIRREICASIEELKISLMQKEKC